MNYITIKSPAKASFIEKRSEFIGYLSPVTTNDEAVEFINSIKAEHRDVDRDGQHKSSQVR